MHKICSFLDKLKPKKRGFYSDQIQFVQNRLGHDYRYAINSNKLKKLGWRSVQNFDDGLQKTVKWYLENSEWMNGFNNPE